MRWSSLYLILLRIMPIVISHKSMEICTGIASLRSSDAAMADGDRFVIKKLIFLFLRISSQKSRNSGMRGSFQPQSEPWRSISDTSDMASSPNFSSRFLVSIGCAGAYHWLCWSSSILLCRSTTRRFSQYPSGLNLSAFMISCPRWMSRLEINCVNRELPDLCIPKIRKIRGDLWWSAKVFFDKKYGLVAGILIQ